jgi:hypothetical protein
LSGGTSGGVPEMALNIGKDLNLPTIGVYPEKGSKYAATSKLDFSISVTSHPMSDISWGSETPVLVSIPDLFILVGGEWGSLTEVSMIMKKNISRNKQGLKPIPIIVIEGSGKLADNITTIAKDFPLPSGSLEFVNTPTQLADLIIRYFY